MHLKLSLFVSSSFLIGFAISSAAVYDSVNSLTSSTSLTDDILAGIAPTGTATREGGDGDTAGIGLASLTNGGSSSTSSGRSFVNAGTLDFDLGGTFNLSTIYFRLVNAVVDDRLAFNANIYTSSNNGGSYDFLTFVEDPFDNIAGQFGTTGTLSDINASPVTNLRFDIGNLGTYSASFAEIDVVGSAIPEPSAYAMIGGLLSLGFVVARRRSTAH